MTYLIILMTSVYARLNHNIPIHQMSCKNKAKPYQCIANQKAKLITFFIWPPGILENIFKVKSLAQLNVWG